MPYSRKFKKGEEMVRVYPPKLKTLPDIVRYGSFIIKLMENKDMDIERGQAIMKNLEIMANIIKSSVLVDDIVEKKEALKKKNKDYHFPKSTRLVMM